MKQQVALGVAHAKGFLVHLGIHMPIGDKNIRPAVIVVIEKFQAEAEKRDAHWAESGSRLLVGEFAGAVVVIEIVGVVGKIGLGQVRPAIVIIIGHVHSHACLLAPIFAVSDAGLRAHLGQMSLAIVVIHQAGR